MAKCTYLGQIRTGSPGSGGPQRCGGGELEKTALHRRPGRRAPRGVIRAPSPAPPQAPTGCGPALGPRPAPRGHARPRGAPAVPGPREADPRAAGAVRDAVSSGAPASPSRDAAAAASACQLRPRGPGRARDGDAGRGRGGNETGAGPGGASGLGAGTGRQAEESGRAGGGAGTRRGRGRAGPGGAERPRLLTRRVSGALVPGCRGGRALPDEHLWECECLKTSPAGPESCSLLFGYGGRTAVAGMGMGGRRRGSWA